MAKVYVSVGSNIDREHNVELALSDLFKAYGELEQSLVYETQSVGFDGDPFYNMVVAFSTDESPQAVAARLRNIEDAHGRDRSGGKFSSRNMDLDLLLYDDLVLEEEGLHLPRKEILEFAFVLKPLSEIAGDMKHPVTGFTFSALWDQFDPTAQPMWPINN